MEFDLIGWVEDQMERVLSSAVIAEPDITDAKLTILVKLAKATGYIPQVTVKLKEGNERIMEKMEHEYNSKVSEFKLQIQDLKTEVIYEQSKPEKRRKSKRRTKKKEVISE